MAFNEDESDYLGDDDNDNDNGSDGGDGYADSTTVVDSEYYNFLHVPHTASQDEINAAYKRLSRVYHPDKHFDQDKKVQAQNMFAKLQKVYDVLNDPHKRAIYDCLGKQGLQEQGWEIVPRTKNPHEIREEYQRLAKEREERRLQQRTNPTSRLQMTVNATDLFERYLYDERYDDIIESSFPVFEVTEVSFAQTVEAPLTNTDKVVLAGNVSARNGVGSGSINCALRRVTSDKSWHEFEVGVGNGPSLGAKLYRKLTTHTFVNVSGSTQLGPHGLKPDLNVSFGHTINKRTMGYLTYSTNWRVHEYNEMLALSQEQSGMATMVVYDSEKFRVMGSLQFGIPYTYLMVSIARKFKEPQSKIRGVFRLGTFGAIVEYGVEQRISRHSTLGATMVVGLPLGITLKIRLNRASQTYSFPLHLSDEILLQPLFYGTVVPVLAWYTIKKLILDPYEAKKKADEKEQQRVSNRTRIAETRKEAAYSVELMRERYNRMYTEESAKNGIIILVALYGQLLSESGELLEQLKTVLDSRSEGSCPPALEDSMFVQFPEVVDVTVPVQCLVEETSRLIFYEGSKSGLAGFFDPCECATERKHLLIQYSYQGQLHQAIVEDHEALRLPRSAHRL